MGSNTDPHKVFERSGLFHTLNGTGVFACIHPLNCPNVGKWTIHDHTVYESSEYHFLQSLAWRTIPVSKWLITIVGKSLK